MLFCNSKPISKEINSHLIKSIVRHQRKDQINKSMRKSPRFHLVRESSATTSLMKGPTNRKNKRNCYLKTKAKIMGQSKRIAQDKSINENIVFISIAY